MVTGQLPVSDLEEMLAWQIRVSRLPAPQREWRFDPARRWRFDFAWPDLMIAAEVDGGTHTGGRHVRGVGYENDCIKLCAAVDTGWRVYRFTAAMVTDGRALTYLGRALTPAPTAA
jgi:very-short-patch-repair endonuclease